MQTWLVLVILGQFLLSIASLIDKFIITSGKVSKPFIYAFFVSILSVAPLLLFLSGLFPVEIGLYGINIPSIINVVTPDINLIISSIVFGFSFFFFLYYLYTSLNKADASDVVPVVGSIAAVGTFVISNLFLGESLNQNFLIGFILLVLGNAFISHFRFTKEIFLTTLFAGILLAINVGVTKLMFSITSFDNGLFWSRIGILVVLFFFLLIPKYSKNISFGSKKTSKGGGFWVIGNTILGGTGNFLILKAIDLGSASLVQALGGIQFVFLTILSFIFGRITPLEFGENNTFLDIIQKGIAIIIISIGFFFLFIK